MKWMTLLSIVFVHDASCRQARDEDFYSKTECCRPRNVSQEMLEDPKGCRQASWELLNTTNGRFKMSFHFSNAMKYTATLYLKEKNTESQCETNNADTNDWPKHTFGNELRVVDWEEGCNECGKTGEFYFQFIFTGCYTLKIIAADEKRNNSTFIKFCPKFLESKYQKQFLISTTEVTPQSSQRTLQINVNENPWKQMLLVNTTLDFTFKNETSSSEIQWELSLQTDRQVNCNSTLVKCDIDSSGILEIFLQDVQPGNYTYKIIINSNKDTRCSLPTLWTDKLCIWDYDQTIPEPSKENVEKPEYFPIYEPVVAGVIVVVIFTLIAGTYAMKRRLPAAPVRAPIAVSIVGERPAILLLYSRDCGPFMKLMESLRRLLEKATEYEIYDCYDPKRWSEVSRDPSAWMQRLTTMRDIRVVAVASQCASLRQRAHLDGGVFHFVTPHNTDKLFEYGLQLLTDRMAQIATYRKAFVVRFLGFSDDSDLFIAINSFTRFVLPSHLDDLVCSLKQDTPDESDTSWIEGEERKVLLDNLDDLVRYKQENTNYLQNMLVIEKTQFHVGN